MQTRHTNYQISLTHLTHSQPKIIGRSMIVGSNNDFAEPVKYANIYHVYRSVSDKGAEVTTTFQTFMTHELSITHDEKKQRQGACTHIQFL